MSLNSVSYLTLDLSPSLPGGRLHSISPTTFPSFSVTSPSHPLLEVSEKGPKKVPKDHQALLNIVDLHGVGVSMVGDLLRR